MECPPGSQNCASAECAFDAPAERVRAATEAAIRETSGWTIGRAESVTATDDGFDAVFRVLVFRDDVRATVAAAEGGARLRLVSRSRVGKGDLGVNARRVRALLAAVDAKLGV